MEDLRRVFQRIAEYGVTLNPTKCKFFQRELPFLGFIVSKEGVRTDPEKVAPVLRSEPPKNKKELRTFMGLVSYYGHFIEGRSRILEPLNELMKKDAKYEWSEERQRAFDEVKKRLSEVPLLIHPDFEREFILQMDVSGFAIGAVLTQLDDEG